MRLWRSKETAREPTRADVILARKPLRAAAGERGQGLLDVVIPRQEVRRTHARGEDRRVLADTAARIVLGAGDFPVPVANISSNGMMIDCDRPLAIGAQVAIAIERCDAIPMVVRWRRGKRVGLEFMAETTIVAAAGVQDFVIDVIRNEQAAAGSGGGPARVGAENRNGGARHALIWLCEVTLASGSVAARIRNISAQGAMVSFDEPARPLHGERIWLAMGENLGVEAEIRWRGEGMAGMVFSEPFPVECLVDQPCARIIEPDTPAPAAKPTYASREEAMRIEYTGLAQPYEAPDMDYEPLTLRELYTTLYGGSDTKR